MHHQCSDCGQETWDNEVLKVCSMCASSNISNWPDETWDNEDDEEEVIEESEREEVVPMFI